MSKILVAFLKIVRLDCHKRLRLIHTTWSLVWPNLYGYFPSTPAQYFSPIKVTSNVSVAMKRLPFSEYQRANSIKTTKKTPDSEKPSKDRPSVYSRLPTQPIPPPPASTEPTPTTPTTLYLPTLTTHPPTLSPPQSTPLTPPTASFPATTKSNNPLLPCKSSCPQPAHTSTTYASCLRPVAGL